MDMKDRLTIASILTILLLQESASSRIEFEGCFYNVNLERGESFELPNFNLNEDCAHFCASRGFILAATRGPRCHCTNILPDARYVLLKPHEVGTLANKDNPCNYVCPGAYHTRVCRGDECCGGKYGNRETYSYYAVGGINPVEVLLTRIRRALRTSNLRWLKETMVFDCHDNFIEQKIQHGHVLLQMTRSDFTLVRNIGSIALCQSRCRRNPTCRSITYEPYENRCYLNRLNSLDAPTEPSDKHTVVYDRNCTSTVEVLPTSFNMKVLHHQMMIQYEPTNDRQPLYSQDFELDLTNSNYWDTLKRSVDISVGNDYTISTESGFERRASTSQTIEEETSETDETTTRKQREKTNTQSFGFKVDVTVTAEAEAFGSSGVKGSVSSGIHGDFAFSQTNSETNTRSKSKTKRRSESNTKEQARTNIYNNDYQVTHRSDKRLTYEYSMSVPALHKGTLNFLLEKRVTIVKLKTTYELSGYLLFDVNGFEKEVHVSRVLPTEERRLATMSTMVYNRPIIVGRSTVTDSDGNIIEREDQLVGNENKGRTGK